MGAIGGFVCVGVRGLFLPITGTTVRPDDYSGVCRRCMSVCEQEHVILSVMCQDLFPLELLGTGHFWRTQKCVGRGSGFLTLENLQAAMLEQRNDLSDLHEDRKTSENTESPFFLINPATGVCHVRNLWWVCMFCILRAGLAKRLLLWSVWERLFFSHASLQSWFLIRGRKLLKVSALIPLFLNMTHSGCLRRLL